MVLVDKGIIWIYLVSIVSHAIDSRVTDDRWFHRPEAEVRAVAGSDVTLRYGYQTPSVTDKPGLLTFAHYVPGDTQEFMMLEAHIDPLTGVTQVIYERIPLKISINSKLKEFTLTIRKSTLSDSGRYFLDLTFTNDAVMHDSVMVQILEAPAANTTHIYEVLTESGSHETFFWPLRTSDRNPHVQKLTFVHTPLEGASYEILTAENSHVTGLWEIVYPDEELHFTGRISFITSPHTDSVNIGLWDLQARDSGLYTLTVVYENDILTNQHTASLYVSQDYAWTRPLPSSFNTLTSLDLSVSFHLRKKCNDPKMNLLFILYRINTTEVEMTRSSVENETSKPNAQDKGNIFLVKMNYDNKESVVNIYFSNTSAELTGDYLLKVYVSVILVLKHSFRINVFEERNMALRLESENAAVTTENATEVNPGHYRLILPDKAPRANISLQKADGMTTYIRTIDSSMLEFELTEDLIKNDIVIIVDYDFYHQEIPLHSSEHLWPCDTGSNKDSHIQEAVVPVWHVWFVFVSQIILLLLVFICTILMMLMLRRNAGVYGAHSATVNGHQGAPYDRTKPTIHSTSRPCYIGNLESDTISSSSQPYWYL